MEEMGALTGRHGLWAASTRQGAGVSDQARARRQLFVYGGCCRINTGDGGRWKMPPLLSCFSSNECLFTFVLYPLLPGTWEMPEFVIRNVLSGGYRYNTHVDVIAIKEHSFQEAGERNGIWDFLALG